MRYVFFWHVGIMCNKMKTQHAFFILMMPLGVFTSVKALNTVAMDLRTCMRYAVVYSSGFPIFAAK